ncbi:hypothetical protein [Polaribacter butkevichii]|uniref:PPM-type phosphatase domain-containing protein n=1 Tax=Polaribacter butkevichii TaxID=218490 RepID=A0A2P6C9N6_9FLAO|nr:hypothetical protein [Polaribacter butkevichii]PQJ69653.1 hypothetical protein BTO14_16815 [Polaribacter butkevichii]
MQISIKGYITAKESELFYDCADRYAYNKSQNKFAISDGVSKSFFPKIWADVLVNKWVDSKEFDEAKFILDCQKDWLNQVTEIVNKPDSKWFTKNAFNRKESGLATFVGLRFYKKKKEWFWKADALGDSFLFFVPKKIKDFSKECIVLSSKQEPIVFDNFPDYLSSLGNNHKGEKQLKENLLTSGTFYLMTDALAEWFLNEKEDAISKINVWQNQKDFERFVVEERYNKKLGNDDSAILMITIIEDEKDVLDYVLEDVSDINELIKDEQKEIEVSKKGKEEELILQKENSNSEISSEEIKQEEPLEKELPEEIKTENEKQKKGFLKRIFGKEENVDSTEEVEKSEKHQKEEEEEPSSKDRENKIEIEKPDDSEKNESQESETISEKESEVKDTIPKNSPKNAIDKF